MILPSSVVSPPQTSIGEAPASSFGAFQGAVPAERWGAGDGLKHVETHCSSLMILMNMMNIKKCWYIIYYMDLYGMFIPLKRYFFGFDPSTALSLSCCDLLWLALQLASIAVLSADVGIAASDVSTFEADNWKPRRLLAIAHWLVLLPCTQIVCNCGLEPVSPVDIILTTAKQQAEKFPTTTSKVNSSTHSWCSANDLKRMPFEHWQASSTTVHSSISGRFNGVDTNLAYPELT